MSFTPALHKMYGFLHEMTSFMAENDIFQAKMASSPEEMSINAVISRGFLHKMYDF